MQCPIDEDTQMQWMVSVVAPPTPVNMTINYMVLNASRIMGIGQVSRQIICYDQFFKVLKDPFKKFPVE